MVVTSLSHLCWKVCKKLHTTEWASVPLYEGILNPALVGEKSHWGLLGILVACRESSIGKYGSPTHMHERALMLPIPTGTMHFPHGGRIGTCTSSEPLQASGGKLLDRGPSAPSGEPTHLPPHLLEPASVPQAAPRALLTCKCLA